MAAEELAGIERLDAKLKAMKAELKAARMTVRNPRGGHVAGTARAPGRIA
jgi:hypothetical protein